MPKNTSVTLGAHFESFIAKQVEGGRYGSASEVVREGLRLVEEREQKLEALRRALQAGEGSALDMKAVICEATQELGRDP